MPLVRKVQVEETIHIRNENSDHQVATEVQVCMAKLLKAQQSRATSQLLSLLSKAPSPTTPKASRQPNKLLHQSKHLLHNLRREEPLKKALERLKLLKTPFIPTINASADNQVLLNPCQQTCATNQRTTQPI